MSIATFEATAFRNISRTELDLSGGMNFFFGQNASGKTALLEAVYYLGRAKSFRCRDVESIIQHGQPALQLFARLASPWQTRLGLERTAQRISVHRNGQSVKTLSLLAEAMPVVFISTENQRLLQDGPGFRRSTLDWGLFHTYPGYAEHYKRYTQALINRNAALRRDHEAALVALWHPELAHQAEVITRIRKAHLDAILARMKQVYHGLLTDFDFGGKYLSGWRDDQSLLLQLERQMEKDRRYGQTLHGPHRDDFRIEVGKRDASVVLSRGQLKRFNIAFVLAQKDLIAQARQRSVVTLMDDLSSELDIAGFLRIINLLETSADQYLITLIESGQHRSDNLPGKLFHVEHGRISQRSE